MGIIYYDRECREECLNRSIIFNYTIKDYQNRLATYFKTIKTKIKAKIKNKISKKNRNKNNPKMSYLSAIEVDS